MIFEGLRIHFRSQNRLKIAFKLNWQRNAPQDVPKTFQDGPKTRPRRPKTPKTAPRRLQDAPKTRPRRSQGAPRRPPRSGEFQTQKQIFSGPPPNLDFGASWARFWEVLASILGGVEVDFFEDFRNVWGIGFGSVLARETPTIPL